MNRIYLEKLDDKRNGAGFRLSDDYANNTAFIDGTPEDDIELLKFVVKNCDDVGSDILQFCNENERGITINDTFYNYEKIKDIINT